MVHSIALDSQRILPVSSLVNGQYGMSDVCISVPTVVGRKGVHAQLEIEIWPKEVSALQHSAQVLRETIDQVLKADSKTTAKSDSKFGQGPRRQVPRRQTHCPRDHGRWRIGQPERGWLARDHFRLGSRQRARRPLKCSNRSTASSPRSTPIQAAGNSSWPMPRTPTWRSGWAPPGSLPRRTHGEVSFKTLEEYREQMRLITRQALVDIMLMSASSSHALTIGERLFDGSPVTPAVRANDTTDIHLARGSVYAAEPSRPFRTASLDHIQCGHLDCAPRRGPLARTSVSTA